MGQDHENSPVVIREIDRDQLSVRAQEKSSEAMHRIQAMYVLARKFPRHAQKSIIEIQEACSRQTLAEKALYAYPRGGQVITGPSIRLAEVFALAWGNMDYGMREIDQVSGPNAHSVIEAYCSDLEKNVHQHRAFQVFHKMKLKGNRGMKVLDDPRDVYEHVANYGARRMRACILALIPAYIREDAESRVKATLKSDAVPLVERVNKMVSAFQSVGVTIDLLEKRLDHATNLITEDELIELRGVYTALKDGEGKRQDFFQLRAEASGGRAAELNDKLQSEIT
jgi:hypothetical protein